MIKNKRLKPEVEKVELDQFWKGEFSIGEIYLPYWMQCGGSEGVHSKRRKASPLVRGRKTVQISDWALQGYARSRAPRGGGIRVGWDLMSAPDAGS